MTSVGKQASVVHCAATFLDPVAVTTGLSAAPTDHKSQLQRLRRRRRRWGVNLASLAARDTLPPETCRAKVHLMTVMLFNS